MTIYTQQTGRLETDPTVVTTGEERRKGVKSRIKEEVSYRTRALIEEQRTRAANRLERTVNAVRRTSENLQREDQQTTAKYLDSFADQVDRFSGYLRNQDMEHLIFEVENSIRRRPGIAIATAVGLGFLLARFLKSSERSIAKLPSVEVAPHPIIATPPTPTGIGETYPEKGQENY
jgi:hypothetical protein